LGTISLDARSASQARAAIPGDRLSLWSQRGQQSCVEWCAALYVRSVHPGHTT
jgi:hypothetical protein